MLAMACSPATVREYAMDASSFDYDLAVIGGGSGGLAAAFAAAGHGARTVLFEPGELGGTCVNAGCVPKKAMWLAAGLAEGFGLAARIGFQDVPPRPDWARLVEHRQAYIAGIHASYRTRLDTAGVSLVPSRARLVDAHTVEDADGIRRRVAHVVVATGAHAVRPSIPGAALGALSDDFFRLTAAPRRVAVVGGGYVAVELAAILQLLGSRVELVVRDARLLPQADAEVAAVLADNLRQQGVRVAFDTTVTALAPAGDGVRVGTDGDFDGTTVDQAFFAVGRRANLAGLGLEALGITPGPDGELPVDEWQDTAVAGVHAIGDVTGRAALTPVAIAAARRLMARLFGGQAGARLDYADIPTVVFAHPPLAQVGLTEAQARERFGADVRVYRSRFRPMLRALAGSPLCSLFKLVCTGPDERVVGIHLLGEGSEEILQGFAVALKMGLTRHQLQAAVALHPTSAEELVLIGP